MKKLPLPYFFILLGALSAYSYSLSLVPVHLNQDELAFSLNAYSIAKNLKDFYGNFLPFYFWHLGGFWATPIMTYLSALVLVFLPLSESSIRFTSVLIGVLDIGLVMAIVHNSFQNKKITVLSGLMISLTPVHFIHARLLLDNLYTVPFVLLWIYFLQRFFSTNKNIFIFFSTLSLGIGIHSYHAAKIVMPIYFLFTLFLLIKKSKKSIFTAFIGFFIPILLFVPWLIKHPDTLLNQVSYIGGLDSTVQAEKGIFGVFNIERLGDFASNYITYLSPKILFIEGDRSLIHSTGKVGAFLAPVALLMIFGFLQIIFHQKDQISKLILFGLFTYPIAPAIVNDPQRISRGLVVIPFMILVSAYGIYYLLKSKEIGYKPLLVILVSISVLQFGFFLSDYFGNYRARSYAWFNNDIGGALEAVIKSTHEIPIKVVYLDANIPFIDIYSTFYQHKLYTKILPPQLLFDSQRQDFSNFGQGSLVLIRYDHLNYPNQEIGEFSKIKTIREVDGNETFYIYFRNK